MHGAVEYVAGVLFIAAPLLLNFESTAAIAVSLGVGILLLVLAAATEGPPGLVNGVNFEVHIVIDFVLALFLIVAPYVFGISDRGDPTVFFVALGVVHLLVTIGTRFKGETTAGPHVRR